MSTLPILDAVDQRILGALLEKQTTVPATYPLSANALIAACNQSNNRDPVTDLDLQVVEQTARSLKERGLLRIVWAPSGRRTLKYHQILDETLGLDPDERAILAVLLLRGEQAPGELRTRTERLHAFAERADVEACLVRMAQRAEPLVRELERRPGQQDARWVHLLGPARPAAAVEAVDRDAVIAEGAEVRDERVTSTYGAVATDYADALVDELDALPFETWLLDRVVVAAAGKPVVEIGSGPGHITAHLAAQGADATGIDLSPAMVAEASRRFPALRFEVGDLRQLSRPATSSGWAAVLGWYSLIHLAPSELPAAIAALARPLAPGGWLVLAAHAGTGVRHMNEWFGHEVELDFVLHEPAELVRIVEAAGLVGVEWYVRGPVTDRGETTDRVYVVARLPQYAAPRDARTAARVSDMTTWLSYTREAIRSRLWPIPVLAVLVALLLGLGVPELDARFDEHLSAGVSELLFGGDADAARSLLGAIASSLITVTSLTFSLTVVTLQLASSQFSPRLLRTFTSDQFVQITLALFLATFTYALTVLRAVRSAGDGGGIEFVPKAAITLAFVLTVASVLGLVLFLAHLTSQIRVETMLLKVHRDATRTMDTTLRDLEPGETDTKTPADPASPAFDLLVPDDGFLTRIDHEQLLGVAVDEDVRLRIEAVPGSFLVRGTPWGLAWSQGGERLDEESAERLTRRVGECLHLSHERTASQDVGYGLRQLTDVANKALSPGINDPTTAIHALGHISAFLCDLTDHDLGERMLSDEHHAVRVVLRQLDFSAYVDLGISQPRRYGAADPQVLERIFSLLLDLAHRVRPEQRSVVREQLARLRGTVAAQRFDAAELASLDELGARIEARFDD